MLLLGHLQCQKRTADLGLFNRVPGLFEQRLELRAQKGSCCCGMPAATFTVTCEAVTGEMSARLIEACGLCSDHLQPAGNCTAEMHTMLYVLGQELRSAATTWRAEIVFCPY